MNSLACLGQEEIQNLDQNHVELIKLANDNRKRLFESPTQSDFRVYSIIIVKNHSGSLIMVDGTNTEQGYIGAAICAERAALAKLRFIDKPVIKKVVVVSDSENPLSPGALCREFLISHALLEVIVVMGNCTNDKISECPLGDLWPFPYLYRAVRRHDVIQFAKSFVCRMENVQDLSISHPLAVELYSKAQSAQRPALTNANIHPIIMSAAILFSDGSIETAYQMNGIEYGCTVDAVTQLIREIEKRMNICVPCSFFPSTADSVFNSVNVIVKPVMLVMVDQFGVAHAPFAQARSLLSEHGYGYIQVLIHDAQTGKFTMRTVDDLIPQPANGCRLLSCNDFH